MKPSGAFRLSLLSAGLALALAPARADDAVVPAVPVPPAGNPATTPADGQTPPPRHRHFHPAFVLGELTAKLGLTPDEQKAVGALIAGNDSQLKALREDDTLSKEDKHAKMKAIVETTRGAIRAALTPDQQKVFDTLPSHGDRGGPPPPVPAP